MKYSVSFFDKSFETHKKNHYHTMNGRRVPHTLVQLLIQYIGKETAFNILNTLRFLALGVLIFKIANGGKQVSPVRLLFIYLMLFTFAPAFGYFMFFFSWWLQ